MRLIVYALGPEPPHGMRMSGGTRFLIEITKRWSRKRENRVYMICSPSAYKTFSREGVRASFHVIPFLEAGLSKPLQLIVSTVGRLIKSTLLNLKWSEGVVISPSDFLWDVLPAFWQKMKNPQLRWVAFVWHIIPPPMKRRAPSFMRNLLSFLSQRLSIRIFARADIIVVANSEVKKSLVRSGISIEKIRIRLSGGVDSREIDEFPSQKKLYSACFVGRLHPTKGVMDLIKIWKHVTSIKKDAVLAIVGGGAENFLNLLKEEVQKEDLQTKIRLLGPVPHEKVYSILKKSEVFIFPSYEEGWGIAIVEAMACGLPVVAYDLPSYGEIYGDSILRIPIGNVESFSNCLLKLLINKELRLHLAEKSRNYSKKFDWDKVADGMLTLLQKISKDGY